MPVSGKRVMRWSSSGRVTRQPAGEWQLSQLLREAPRWKSSWHVTQSRLMVGGVVARDARRAQVLPGEREARLRVVELHVVAPGGVLRASTPWSSGTRCTTPRRSKLACVAAPGDAAAAAALRGDDRLLVVRVRVTELALVRRHAPPDVGCLRSEGRGGVALRALELRVRARQRPARHAPGGRSSGS